MVNTHCLLCEARNGLFERRCCGIFFAQSWVPGRHGVTLCRVTLVCLGVPNDSVELFPLKGTTMNPGQARLCVTQCHIRVLIAETPPFDRRHVNARWMPLRKPKGAMGISSSDAALEEVEVFNRVNTTCRCCGIQKDRRPSHPSAK